MWRVGITCLPRPQSCFEAGKKECLVESETFRRAVRRLLIARVLGCVLPGTCTRMAAGQIAVSCWVAGFIRDRGGADPNKPLSSCLAGVAMCCRCQAAWRLTGRSVTCWVECVPFRVGFPGCCGTMNTCTCTNVDIDGEGQRMCFCQAAWQWFLALGCQAAWQPGASHDVHQRAVI